MARWVSSETRSMSSRSPISVISASPPAWSSSVDQRAARFDRRLTIEDQPALAKDRLEEARQRPRHLAVLRKDQHLLLLDGDRFADLAHPREFATGPRRIVAIAEPLRRMVADLL